MHRGIIIALLMIAQVGCGARSMDGSVMGFNELTPEEFWPERTPRGGAPLWAQGAAGRP